jgi:hypothetical protein
MADSKTVNPMQQNAARRSSEKFRSAAIARILLQERDLSQRQLTAMPFLLRGLSDIQVGEHLGVDRGTVARWRKDPKFIEELERQRQVLWQQSVDQLQSMFQPALEILQKQLAGDDPKTALRAASILLRVASPARIARLVHPEPSQCHSDQSGPLSEDAIDAYINAPMPDEPGHPANRLPAVPGEDDSEDADAEDSPRT